MFRKILYALILFSFSLELDAQFWKLYTEGNGLLTKELNDVALDVNHQVWIASDSGLSFFNGNNFIHYTRQNSAIASNAIKELEVINGEVFMLTDSGLSKFDGRRFTNFNTQNGLLSNTIRSMASDTNGVLWLASPAGISRYDGVSFTHDTGKFAVDIVVDDSNRVYILRYSVVFNIPNSGLTVYEIFDGQNWISPPMNSFADYYRSQFYKSPNGKILLMPSGGGKQFYGELRYPFNIFKRSIDTESSVNRTPRMMKELNGERWMNYWGVSSLYRGLAKDSSYEALYLLPTGVDVKEIVADSVWTVAATDEGLLIGPSNYETPQFSEHLDINEIKAGMHLQGAIFQDYKRGLPYFEYPADSNSYLITAANFQLGIKRDSTDGNFRVFPEEIYNQPFDVGPYHKSNQLFGDQYLVKINKHHIDNHRLSFNQASYTPHESILNWPANADSNIFSSPDLAPFHDANSNGCYEPMQGDYPIIKGDQAIYWINHPKDKSLPLEYHWMLYAYNTPNDTALNRSIFLQLRLVNRDTGAYNYIKPAFRVEADLGFPNDDFNGSDSSRSLMYFYNGDTYDENFRGRRGYLGNPPAMGIKTLSSDAHSTTFYQTAISYPYSDSWNYLHGMNGDSTYFVNPINLNSTRHQFSGDPYNNTGWTEQNLNPNKPAGNQPGDRKGTISFPAFSLAPGQDHSMELVINVAQKTFRTGTAEYLPLLNSQTDYLENFYKNQINPPHSYSVNFSCPIVVGMKDEQELIKGLNIYPNPAEDQLNILSDQAIELIQIIDLNGRVVEEIRSLRNGETIQIREGLTNGVYLLRTRTTEGWYQQKFIIQR